MTTIYKFDNTWVRSTVDVHADGSVTEIAGGRWWTAILDYQWDGPGTVFPTIDAWVSAMVTEINEMRDRSYRGRHCYELSYIPEDEAARSSVAWVLPEKRFMEIRRGLQTKLAPGECRYWPTVEKWRASLTPPKNAVAVAGAAPAVAVKKEAAAAVVVAVPPFNPEKFQKDFDGLITWARGKCAQTKPAAIIQICAWLLEMKARPTVAIWLEETPLWRVSIRTIVQAREWEWTTPASAAAVVAFLATF